MRRSFLIALISLIVFNVLLLLSFGLTYADSHGVLPQEAVTEGTLPNALISAVHIVSVYLALIPCGCAVFILAITQHAKARKAGTAHKRERVALVVAVPAFLFTLASKSLYFASVAAVILYPDHFHI